MESIEPGQLSYWYNACTSELVLYARGWLDSALAEDVVQEVFIRLMGQRRRPDNVRAWLFRCVRNAAISRQRQLKRRKTRHERLAAEKRSWFEARPDDLIDAQTAQRILETLPGGLREIVVLRIWGQMSFKDMAKILEMPLSSVYHHYHEALAQIRKKMELSSCKTKKI